MGKITYFPTNKNSNDSSNTQSIDYRNNDEYVEISLEEFFNGLNITTEAEERFMRGLLEIIKDECANNFSFARIFKDAFKAKK